MRFLLFAIFTFFTLSALGQTEGTIRYNATSLQFYNGTSWVNFDKTATGLTCSEAGGVRYNSGSSRMEFCDGSNWYSGMGESTGTGCSEAGAINYDSTNKRLRICNGSSLVSATDMFAAPTFVSTTSTRNADTGTSMDIAKPSGLAVGDLMIAFVGKNNTNTVSGPIGWTHQGSEPVTTYGGDVLTKLADAGDVLSSDFQFTWTGSTDLGDRHGIITAYRNVNQTTPVDFFASQNGSGSTATYLGGTTSYNNTLVVVIGGSFSMPSTPSGFTSRNSDGWATRVSDKVEATAGSVGTYTSTALTNWSAFTLAITGGTAP